MPYDIRRSGSQYQVVSESGTVVGTHPTRSAAEEQRRAVYANEEAASKGEQPVKSTWQGQFFPTRR